MTTSSSNMSNERNYSQNRSNPERNSSRNSYPSNGCRIVQHPRSRGQITTSEATLNGMDFHSPINGISTNADVNVILDFPFCDDVNTFERLNKIGQGTFGEVFRGKHKKSHQIVALKKILTDSQSEGFPVTALREIKILMQLKHENIVELKDVCRETGFHPNLSKNNSKLDVSDVPFSKNLATFYLVFEFCDHDLAGLLANPAVIFSLGELKMMMKQLLSGLFFVHSNKILHRDLKSANILVTREGVLKLADFGLARAYSESVNGEPKRYTNIVVTLWYRPPELLLGERNYNSAVDMWGAGCIMSELWTRVPILKGETEIKQVELIARLCGSITEEVWPDVSKLPLFKTITLPKNQKSRIRERLQIMVNQGPLQDGNALGLVEKLLVLDPSKRLSANEALDHRFFWSNPMPACFKQKLNQHNSMFEYTTSLNKQRERARLASQHVRFNSHNYPHASNMNSRSSRGRGVPPPGWNGGRVMSSAHSRQMMQGGRARPNGLTQQGNSTGPQRYPQLRMPLNIPVPREETTSYHDIVY